MGTRAGEAPDWKAWNHREWGEALFRHYFVAGQRNASPVSRIVLTPDNLAKATADSSISAAIARDAFLTAIRCSPSEFRRRLSSATLVRGGCQDNAVPPFLAYLLFTCFAAASLDTSTISEGDFRERLRILLKHPVGTSYPLPDLPLLWTAFARWLGKRREEGAPYRVLLLPDPGWMTRIGHSVRLTFPSRLDTRQLITLLHGQHLGTTPTVHEVLQLIDHNIRKFSSAFGEVYTRARRAYISGKDAPELQALWSAVLEIASVTISPRSERTRRIKYQLFVQEDELLRADPFVLATAPPSLREHRMVFERLEDPIRDYQFLLRASDGSVIEITRMLLRGALNTTLPHLTRSPLGRTVDQGVLLFARGSNAVAELAESCPVEGAAVALVRQSLSKSFLALLPDRTQARNSKFDGWVEIGPFELATLRRPTEKNSPQLMRVRALQATTVGAQIRLAGGQRIDGGYLGLRGMLPAARCPGATDIIGIPLLPEEEKHLDTQRVPLRRSSSEAEAFAFESGDLDGLFNLVAKNDDQVIASREIHFRSRVLSYDYAVPTDPQRWIIEASPSDVLPASGGRDCFLAAASGNSVNDSLRLPRPVENATNDHESSEVMSVDDDPALDRFVEALAAICASRKGIAESEFLELLESMLQVEAGPEIWDVVRAWLEAGYVDALSRRHWRGRFYFARRPRLVITRNDSDTYVVLHGLAPHSLRARAATTLDRMGATPVPFRVVSRTVGAPQTWSIASTALAEIAAAELGLGALEHVKHFAELVVPLTDDALSSDIPTAYELQGVWDWNSGGFRKRRIDKKDAVSIEWLARQDRPDRFVVHRSDGASRSTFSRNWALLMGYFWAKTPPFSSDGPTRLVRALPLGPYLPLPVARAVVLRSHVVSGPIGDLSNDHGYLYEVTTTRERDHLLHWAMGRFATVRHPRHLTWLLSALSESSGGVDAVAIPGDLRRRLTELKDLPHAALVSKKRIPRRMLPLLRRTLDLVGA
jgi:hypothetical protein